MKGYARNTTESLYVAREKEIVIDTTVNLEMISSTGNTLVNETQLNVIRMRNHTVELQRKLYEFYQRVSKED